MLTQLWMVLNTDSIRKLQKKEFEQVKAMNSVVGKDLK